MTTAAHIGREIGALAPSAQLAQNETILSFIDPHVVEAVRQGRSPTHDPAEPGAAQKRLTGVAPGSYLEFV